MYSFIIAGLTGLVAAAALHILAIFMLPFYSQNDVWSKVQSLGDTRQFYPVSKLDSQIGFSDEDPYIKSAVCYFDLNDGPVRIFSDIPTQIWTFASFDTNSDETFSMSASSSVDQNVDVLIVSSSQLLALRRSDPELVSETISIELSQMQGYVVLRAIMSNDTSLEVVDQFLSTASCATQDVL